jgi:hypothetical protein
MRRAYVSNSLALAGLAAFGFILELFIVEKKLFPSGKDKLCTAICAL